MHRWLASHAWHSASATYCNGFIYYAPKLIKYCRLLIQSEKSAGITLKTLFKIDP